MRDTDSKITRKPMKQQSRTGLQFSSVKPPLAVLAAVSQSATTDKSGKCPLRLRSQTHPHRAHQQNRTHFATADNHDVATWTADVAAGTTGYADSCVRVDRVKKRLELDPTKTQSPPRLPHPNIYISACFYNGRRSGNTHVALLYAL